MIKFNAEASTLPGNEDLMDFFRCLGADYKLQDDSISVAKVAFD